MPVEPQVLRNSQVIHAFHGVTEDGDWILLADVRPLPPVTEADRGTIELHFDENWLVVLGRRDRDIITLQGQDA